MSVVTSLSFRGQTQAALQYYENVLDAEILFLMRFRDSPDQSHTRPGMEDLIFHATFRILGTVFTASDVGYEDANSKQVFSKPMFVGFSLCLQIDSPDVGKRMFDALSDQGQVVIPFAESKFTAWYGIVVDRFGVSWKLNVGAKSG
jgi:PhnB protein